MADSRPENNADPAADTCCGADGALPRPGLERLPAETELLYGLLAAMDQPAAPVEAHAVGGRFVAVSAGGRVGLASTLGASPTPADHDALAGLRGGRLDAAAGLLLNESPLLASVGLAALNAGFAPPPNAPGLPAGDLLPDLCRNRHVVVVGDFPFVTELAGLAASLTVLELRPGRGTEPAPEPAEVMDRCQVAAISATTLLTRSLAGMLAAAPNALKVLVGPSTPWSPELFARGVDVLAGSVVTAPEAVLSAVAQDLSFRQIKRSGVRLAAWTRPGLAL